jgi:hypothetical protein
MDEAGTHVKWNKPDCEGQILHVLSHRQNLKNQECKRRLGWGMCGGGNQQGEGEWKGEYDRGSLYPCMK